ncbi:TIGR01777 family oxidoreductase [Planctomycetes bacterium K23_9]|uniref:Epimerase family protein n=1 Tax=Stieleria marina TaxID=1930275 RepID=A0A517NUU4_9BACT|nr:Epimerase family protein [Planctomycetes bacterium K23_9]
MQELDNKRIVIAGGSGFLGTSLANYFAAQGAQVVVLSRKRPAVSGNWETCIWDARTCGEWLSRIEGADAVVNLTGRTVDCIKTPDHQDEILRSRVESTRALGLAMQAVDSPPSVWLQMSTAHIYGDPPALVCDEDSATGLGFAPTVGRAWESAFYQSRLPSQRGVVMRTSFVIGRDLGAGGGAMSKLALLARLGLGGRVGSGRHGMSWIHQSDLNRLFAHAITDASMSGVYIASSPNPVAQVDFMRALRKFLKMPIGLPAFEWMVRIGAPLLMNTDAELALYGRYVVSKRLRDQGFTFQFSDLNDALRELYAKPCD